MCFFFHIEDRLKTYQNHYSFHLEKKFIGYKINFSGQVDQFSPDFFSEN